MKVFVGINTDSDIDFRDSEGLRYKDISVKVKSLKVLDLDTLSLIDSDIKDCKGIIGFNFSSEKNEYDFKVECDYSGDDICIGAEANSNYITSKIAVYQNGSLLGGKNSIVCMNFNDSFTLEFNLSNFTFKILCTTYTLYDGLSIDSTCNGYEDLYIFINIKASILDATNLFSKVDKLAYRLFDDTYIIKELYNDIIISSGVDTLVIYFDKVHKLCNVVIPPSLDRLFLFIGRYCISGSEFCDDIDNKPSVTFIIPESKRDKILGLIVDRLRYPNISHLTDMQVLSKFDLDVKYY